MGVGQIPLYVSCSPRGSVVQALDYIRAGKIDLVINVPEGSSKDGTISNGTYPKKGGNEGDGGNRGGG